MAHTRTLIALALTLGSAACSSTSSSRAEVDTLLYTPRSSETRVNYTTPKPAPLAEDRKVNEQDCSKPLDYTLGNIRCK